MVTSTWAHTQLLTSRICLKYVFFLLKTYLFAELLTPDQPHHHLLHEDGSLGAGAGVILGISISNMGHPSVRGHHVPPEISLGAGSELIPVGQGHTERCWTLRVGWCEDSKGNQRYEQEITNVSQKRSTRTRAAWGS